MKKPIDFILTIEGAEFYAWQGTVRSPENERMFKSELELLFFIQEELQRYGEAKPLPRWEKEDET